MIKANQKIFNGVLVLLDAVVCAAAMVCAVRNGCQAALMAPTEILAEQH